MVLTVEPDRETIRPDQLVRQGEDQEGPPERRPPGRCDNLVWNLGRYQLYANLYFAHRIHNPPTDTVHPDPEGEWTGSYLLKHPRETMAEWNERRRAAFFLPYPREIVRTYIDALFHQEVSRKSVEQSLGERGPDQLANIDGRGHVARWWLKNKVATLSELYGWVAVLTDMPRDDGRPRTAYHRTDLPYSRVVVPTRLWDWRQDGRTGSFTYALIWETTRTWRAWYPDHWELLDAQGELLDAGDHQLGEVPLDLCTAEPNEAEDQLEPFGVSSLAGADRLALHVYQLCSLLDTHERKALFAFLRIEKDPPKERQQATESDVVLGESHILWSRGAVGWVEPPKSVPEEAREQILWAIQEMRRASGVSTWTEQIRERQSGSAIELSHSDRKRAVARRGEELEDFENRFWQRRGRLLGRPVPSDSVRYPRDYAVAPVEEELAEIRAIVDVFGGWAATPDELRPYLWVKWQRIVIRDVGHLVEADGILRDLEPLTAPGAEEQTEPTSPPGAAVGLEGEAPAASAAGKALMDVEALKADLSVVEQLVKAKTPDELIRVLVIRIAERLDAATPEVRAAVDVAQFRWYTEVQAEIAVTGEPVGGAV